MTIKANPLNFNSSPLTPIERITRAVPTIATDHSAIHEKAGFSLDNKMDIASTKVGVISIRPPTNVAASVTIDMTNATSDLTYTAVATGYGGNSITVTHVDPSANNAPLSVSVSGTDIIVNLATGVAGAITSTAALVKTAVNAHAGALLLVVCEDEGTGTGIVNAVVETALANGTAASYVHLQYMSVGVSAGPATLTLIEDATFTGNTSTLTPVNRHRGGVVPASKIPVTASVDGAVVNGAGVLTMAVHYLNGATAGTKIGSQSTSDKEWVLAPGKNYLIAIANATSPGASLTANYNIFWYEEEAL